MYALVEDRKRKFLLALRTSVPIVVLTSSLVLLTLEEERTLLYDASILLAGLFASVYFIFFMIFETGREKILDDITQTFNRKYFERFLARFVRPKRTILALFSIDNIKEINERYGIENGDKVLQKFAQILDDFLSKRFGSLPIGRIKAGDFLVAINANESEVEKAVEEFLKEYDNSFIDNIEIKIFAAFEVASANIKASIDHLYEEIHFCKGRCKVDTKHDGVVRKKREDSDEFERFIAKMIEQRNLSILFQPTLNLHTNSFDLAEIIVKLKDEEGNIIHPSQFVPVINRMGLENDFDLALCEILLEQIERYRLPSIFYSLNISPYSVRNKNFSQRLFTLFAQASLDPSYVVIELYESSIYKDVNFYKKILQSYKERGFLLAFDNFGACNASIEYIKRIEVDFVHFDKFFTKRVDERTYEILLQSWIEAFSKLSIKSVVKFIDEPSLIERFKGLGADYVQGFGVAKPMSAKDFQEFMRSR